MDPQTWTSPLTGEALDAKDLQATVTRLEREGRMPTAGRVRQVLRELAEEVHRPLGRKKKR